MAIMMFRLSRGLMRSGESGDGAEDSEARRLRLDPVIGNAYDFRDFQEFRGQIMRVSKWGNSLAVRLPKALVEDLGLKPGDELEVVSAVPTRIALARDECRARAVERMSARAWTRPDGYAFDRNEVNAR